MRSPSTREDRRNPLGRDVARLDGIMSPTFAPCMRPLAPADLGPRSRSEVANLGSSRSISKARQMAHCPKRFIWTVRSVQSDRMAKRRNLPGRAHNEGIPPRAVRIIDWLRQSGNYARHETHPQAGFVIHGRYPRQVPPPGQPMNFAIVLPMGDPTAVAVVANILLSDEQRQMVRNLDPAQREALFNRIADGLFFNCGFALQQDPASHEYLGIQLSEEIYEDRPLTQDALMSTLHKIMTAAVLISKRVQEAGPGPFVQA